MPIKLDSETENLITQVAAREHISSAQLIKKLLSDYTTTPSNNMLADMIDSLPELPTFKGNPLDIQKAMRDGWD
ncbi:MAG: hypothetical protein QX199_16800 [Methylococcaceae bacterium]